MWWWSGKTQHQTGQGSLVKVVNLAGLPSSISSWSSFFFYVKNSSSWTTTANFTYNLSYIIAIKVYRLDFYNCKKSKNNFFPENVIDIAIQFHRSFTLWQIPSKVTCQQNKALSLFPGVSLFSSWFTEKKHSLDILFWICNLTVGKNKALLFNF